MEALVFSLILLGSIVLLLILSTIWIYRDANSRGKQGLLIALLSFLSFPIGLLLWVAMRPKNIGEGQAENKSKTRVLWGLIALFLIGFIFLRGYLIKLRHTRQITKDIARIEIELKKYKPIVDKMNEAKEMLETNKHDEWAKIKPLKEEAEKKYYSLEKELQNLIRERDSNNK